MINFAINHMTVARLSFVELLAAAGEAGCIGIEVRNDLSQQLFDGLSPERAGEMAREKGLRLLALAEVKRFNDWSAAKEHEALALMKIAVACGAEAISLIPRNDGLGAGDGERQAALATALRALKPMLEDHGLVGMVEPLGFEICALRYKSEAVEAIEELGATGRFKLVHDTFHHHLAGGGPIYPQHTGIVHVSAVTDPLLAVGEMLDSHRVLVDGSDLLGNAAQIRALVAAGFDGPISFECFAPEVHAMSNPVAAIGKSMTYLQNSVCA